MLDPQETEFMIDPSDIDAREPRNLVSIETATPCARVARASRAGSTILQ